MLMETRVDAAAVQKLEAYLVSVPGYYFPSLKRALTRCGLQVRWYSWLTLLRASQFLFVYLTDALPYCLTVVNVPCIYDACARSPCG